MYEVKLGFEDVEVGFLSKTTFPPWRSQCIDPMLWMTSKLGNMLHKFSLHLHVSSLIYCVRSHQLPPLPDMVALRVTKFGYFPYCIWEAYHDTQTNSITRSLDDSILA